MPFNEALFWVGITVLGTGLYICWERHLQSLLWSLLLALMGLGAVIYSVYIHSHPGAPRPPIWLILLILTWVALGYVIYVGIHDRRKVVPLRWIASIVSYDEENMQNLIHVRNSESAKAHLEAPDPYVDIDILILNASIFKIVVEQADGRLQFGGEPLGRDLELLDKRRIPIEHGRESVAAMRQWLSRDVATLMIKSAHADLDVGRAGVLFSYEDTKGARKTFRAAFGNRPIIIVKERK